MVKDKHISNQGDYYDEKGHKNTAHIFFDAKAWSKTDLVHHLNYLVFI